MMAHISKTITATLRSAGVVVLILSIASPALAQSPSDLQAIRQELAGLREALQAMAKDMEALGTLLQQAMGPASGPARRGRADRRR